MKNLSLILNAILLVAVAVLFYFQFSGTKAVMSSPSSVDLGDAKIAYIRSDSVLQHYEYLKVNRLHLEERTKKMRQDYQNRAVGLQNEIAAYQRNVSSMTLGQVRATEEDLGKKQQNLQMFEQSLGQQLMEEQEKLNKELYDRVTVFLKKYGEEKGLQFVLKLDQSSDVLFAGTAMDISKDVIDGLNAEYKQEKSGAAVKKDSAAVKK